MCIKELISNFSSLPIIFLGGGKFLAVWYLITNLSYFIKGGYNFSTTSRLWTYLTSIIANVEIDNDIPEHDDLMTYSPDFELFTTASKVIKNKNSQVYIDCVLNQIMNNLSMIKS